VKWPVSLPSRLAHGLLRVAYWLDGLGKPRKPPALVPEPVKIATAAEALKYSGDPRLREYESVMALWEETAKKEKSYFLALYDDKESGVFKVWLESVQEEWFEGRVLAFFEEPHLLHYIKIVCQRDEKLLSEFKSWKVGYREMATVVGRISDSFVKKDGKGIRIDLCTIDQAGDVITGCPLWDNLTT